VVIDSVTKAEELAVAHTLATVPCDKGRNASSIEGYGFGKGYVHVYETFLTLFPILAAHIRAGRNVVLIAHECTATVPNPQDEDFLRFEPRLQSPSSGKASIRLRVKEECDHLLFLHYDLVVDDKGRARGSGSRTVYPRELPWCMAKSRTLSDPFPFSSATDATLWTRLLQAEAKSHNGGSTHAAS
jgi:hypothetical protein